MKTFLAFLLLTLVALPGALAQPGARETRTERGQRKLDHRLDMLDEQLGLTDTQEARIRAIIVQEFQRLRARAEAARADKEHRRDVIRSREADPDVMRRHYERERARIRAEWEQLDREIRAVLTPDQARRYVALRREEIRRFEERMRERRPEGREGPRDERPRGYAPQRPGPR